MYNCISIAQIQFSFDFVSIILNDVPNTTKKKLKMDMNFGMIYQPY